MRQDHPPNANVECERHQFHDLAGVQMTRSQNAAVTRNRF